MGHEVDCECGARAAEVILAKAYRIDIRKALDPLDPEDFLVIVDKLATAMSRATEQTEVAILNAALRALDVDWENLSETARDKVIEAAGRSLEKIPGRVIPALEHQLTITGPNMVTGARRGERARLGVTFRASIAVKMDATDRRIIEHAVRSQGLYVRDEYGRRREHFSRVAREVVAHGLEQGLGRDDIAADLQNRLGIEAGIARSRAYYQVIAGTFANRARTWGQLASYRDAGIERYRFEAVMDERTTEQCRYLNGKTFDVSRGIQLYQAVEESSDPEAVRDITPWVRVGRDENGRQIIFTETRDGDRTLIAEVTRSGVGSRDDAGEFARGKSAAALQEMGACMPPLHANCRSTIVADV